MSVAISCGWRRSGRRPRKMSRKRPYGQKKRRVSYGDPKLPHTVVADALLVSKSRRIPDLLEEPSQTRHALGIGSRGRFKNAFSKMELVAVDVLLPIRGIEIIDSGLYTSPLYPQQR